MRIYRTKLRLLRTLLITFALSVTGTALGQVSPTDEELIEAVGAELRLSDLVQYERIRLTAEDGILSITGSVPSITASRQIDDVAATVRGVRTIVNRLDVAPGPMSIDAVRANAITVLDNNSAMDLYELDVTVSDERVATITGIVDSWAEYELAETIVGTARGVRSIDNQIQVESASHLRGAGEIHDDIAERLRWDARVNDSLISILVREGGRVSLSGTVGSLAEKRLATSLAHVSGARDVDASHLNVESWARDEDRVLGASAMVDNADIGDAIASALTLDPRVPSNAIDVTVVEREIWLRGEVASVSASRAAERTAQNTRGARRVHNFLTVRSMDLDNDDVVRRMFDAINASDTDLAEPITISADGGNARIVGNVSNVQQYLRIDDIAANTLGVESVTNELTIRGEQPRIMMNPFMDTSRVLLPSNGSRESLPSDRILHSDIQSELFWSPFVDEDKIEIDVDDGVVTLSGVVDSMSESLAAEENAVEGGATVVNNNIEVQ